jgi:hypothetical protein
VLELDKETVAGLANRMFLRLSQVTLRPVPNVIFWVYGFPVETSIPDPSNATLGLREMTLIAPPVQGVPPLAGFNPAFHFLVDANREGLCWADGTPADIPKRLNGISGSSIWQTAFNPSLPMDGDNPRIYSVGVQTSYYAQSSIIQATLWAAVANILWQRRPDLRGLIELHLGPPR